MDMSPKLRKYAGILNLFATIAPDDQHFEILDRYHLKGESVQGGCRTIALRTSRIAPMAWTS